MKRNILGLFLVLGILFFSTSVCAFDMFYDNAKYVTQDLDTALNKLSYAYENAGHQKRTTYWLEEAYDPLIEATGLLYSTIGNMRGKKPNQIKKLEQAKSYVDVATFDKLKHAKYNAGHKSRARYWIDAMRKNINLAKKALE